MWDKEITQAIREYRLIGFMYGGHYRIGEPHIFGLSLNKNQVLVYQTGGTSSRGGLPQWRRFNVTEISLLRLLDERFPGQRPGWTGHHSDWDEIFEMVK